MVWIRRYFFRIRIRGSVILNYRSGSGSGRPIKCGSGRIRIIPWHVCGHFQNKCSQIGIKPLNIINIGLFFLSLNLWHIVRKRTRIPICNRTGAVITNLRIRTWIQRIWIWIQNIAANIIETVLAGRGRYSSNRQPKKVIFILYTMEWRYRIAKMWLHKAYILPVRVETLSN